MQGLFCLTEILKGNNNYVFLTDTLTSNFGEKQKFQFSIKSTTLVCQLNKNNFLYTSWVFGYTCTNSWLNVVNISLRYTVSGRLHQIIVDNTCCKSWQSTVFISYKANVIFKLKASMKIQSNKHFITSF